MYTFCLGYFAENSPAGWNIPWATPFQNNNDQKFLYKHCIALVLLRGIQNLNSLPSAVCSSNSVCWWMTLNSLCLYRHGYNNRTCLKSRNLEDLLQALCSGLLFQGIWMPSMEHSSAYASYSSHKQASGWWKHRQTSYWQFWTALVGCIRWWHMVNGSFSSFLQWALTESEKMA